MNTTLKMISAVVICFTTSILWAATDPIIIPEGDGADNVTLTGGTITLSAAKKHKGPAKNVEGHYPATNVLIYGPAVPLTERE